MITAAMINNCDLRVSVMIDRCSNAEKSVNLFVGVRLMESRTTITKGLQYVVSNVHIIMYTCVCVCVCVCVLRAGRHRCSVEGV